MNVRTFGEKLKSKQLIPSAISSSEHRGPKGNGQDQNLDRNLQLRFGNQKVEQYLQSNTEEIPPLSISATSPSIGHDFSRILVGSSTAIESGGTLPSIQASPVQVSRQGGTIENPAPSSPGNRTYPNVKVWINSFIPYDRIYGPPGSDCFAGDNRSFSNDIHASSRAHQEIEVRPDLTPTVNWKRIGTTHEVDCITGSVLGSGTASTDQVTNGPILQGQTSEEVLINFSGATKNPLVYLAPAIDFSAHFRINLLTRRCNFNISHDGFPAYEAYVAADGDTGVSVYAYDPSSAGEGISALFPPMDKSNNVSNISF
jgi:hypothetical protein